MAMTDIERKWIDYFESFDNGEPYLGPSDHCEQHGEFIEGCDDCHEARFDGPFERTELKTHCEKHEKLVWQCQACHDAYYWELDERMTRGDFVNHHLPSPVDDEDEPQAGGRAMLMWATETDNIEDARAVALGRPRKGAAPTVTVKAVMPEPMAKQVKNRAHRDNVSAAEVVRSAVAEYLAKPESTDAARSEQHPGGGMGVTDARRQTGGLLSVDGAASVPPGGCAVAHDRWIQAEAA